VSPRREQALRLLADHGVEGAKGAELQPNGWGGFLATVEGDTYNVSLDAYPKATVEKVLDSTRLGIRQVEQLKPLT
jgi:hypothetical protein